MIESAIGGIAVPVFEQVWKAGGFAIDVIKTEYNKAEAVNKLIAASNRYEQKYKKRHVQIKIMPSLMKEPLPLESIYTAVEAKALRDYLDANKLLIRCKQSAVRISRKAWEDLEARLLILG